MSEQLLQYLTDGPFWAAAFLALLASIYWGVNNTGQTEGHLKWQVNLVKTSSKVKFVGVFLVWAFIFNAALIGLIAASSAV